MVRLYNYENELKRKYKHHQCDWIVKGIADLDIIEIRAVKWVDSLYESVSIVRNIEMSEIVTRKIYSSTMPEDLILDMILESGIVCLREIDRFVERALEAVLTIDEVERNITGFEPSLGTNQGEEK